jgi:hypothetical protein
MNFRKMAEGGGRITGLTSKHIIVASQIRTILSPNNTGGRTFHNFFESCRAIQMFTHQADNQNNRDKRKNIIITPKPFSLK